MERITIDKRELGWLIIAWNNHEWKVLTVNSEGITWNSYHENNELFYFDNLSWALNSLKEITYDAL